MNFIRKHGQLALMALVLAAVLCAVYGSAMLSEGLWYDGTFLRQKDGGYFESSAGDMTLEIRPTSEGARAFFTLDGQQREYRLSTRTRMTEIHEDGRLRFRGSVQKDGGSFRFLDERGQPLKDGLPQTDGFPDFRQVYSWVMGEHLDTRGNPAVLIFVGIFACLLVLNGAWPRLAPRLGLGKGSRRYEALRMPLQWILSAAVLLLLVLGFLH